MNSHLFKRPQHWSATTEQNVSTWIVLFIAMDKSVMVKHYKVTAVAIQSVSYLLIVYCLYNVVTKNYLTVHYK